MWRQPAGHDHGGDVYSLATTTTSSSPLHRRCSLLLLLLEAVAWAKFVIYHSATTTTSMDLHYVKHHGPSTFGVYQLLSTLMGVVAGSQHMGTLMQQEMTSLSDASPTRAMTSPGSSPPAPLPISNMTGLLHILLKNHTTPYYVPANLVDSRNKITVSHLQPKLEYFGFFVKVDTTPRTQTPPQSPYPQPVHIRFNSFVVWVSLLAVTCFLLGVVLTCAGMCVVYRKKRARRRSAQRFYRNLDNEDHSPRMNAGHLEDIPDVLEGAERGSVLNNDRYFRYREDYEQDDTKCTLSIIPNDLLDESYDVDDPNLLPKYSTYNGYINPFVNQFSESLSNEGGEVNSVESEALLIVPEGALTQRRKRHVFVNVALGADCFNFKLHKLQLHISPVVECVCPGERRFRKPVILRLPHRALMTTQGSVWTIYVHWTPTPLSNESTWMLADMQNTCNVHSEITYTYNSDYVYVHTWRPGAFTVTGRTSRPRLLRLSAVTYADLRPVEEGTCPTFTFRTYICDNYADAQKRVHQLETGLDNTRVSHHQSLNVYSERDWEVCLTNAHTDDWPWSLHHPHAHTQVIGMDKCYRTGGVPPHVTFLCTLHSGLLPCEPESMQLTFNIAQQRRDSTRRMDVQCTTRHIHIQWLYTSRRTSEASTESRRSSNESAGSQSSSMGSGQIHRFPDTLDRSSPMGSGQIHRFPDTLDRSSPMGSVHIHRFQDTVDKSSPIGLGQIHRFQDNLDESSPMGSAQFHRFQDTLDRSSSMGSEQIHRFPDTPDSTIRGWIASELLPPTSRRHSVPSLYDETDPPPDCGDDIALLTI